MNEQNECRRCHDCTFNSHHWMQDFDDGEWKYSPEPRPVWGCKHCGFTMPMDANDIDGERVEELYAAFMLTTNANVVRDFIEGFVNPTASTNTLGQGLAEGLIRPLAQLPDDQIRTMIERGREVRRGG